ncbi:phage major tail protein, TP901-1 family [Pelagibacterium halotolerans]|uniref:Gene transfer agent (GTA) n=1 Tax=Pelagibacterium halotolerans (strain DSM 22347 / JCM 15775 / CGMCC 1.7692 / B2) TaxID=1082931 RepID=G4RE09_PELHB|nr:phage major tail protein, TP901-1 family [Pelagibacterium halotolerans]AEQ50803.1 gene transfer agent (GTA) [Pelagibacterium halotolerans B2]QJR19281.1 phage major tail protein, TP901-1 family [Pelagibacterium halotolerans]SDZ96428.1 phage major tail protein, TP901-1 family [Pelagibacterium halotolerans]
MTAQSGKDMLLKLDQTGSGSFLTVAGLRTKQLAFNAASVDTTDAESAGRWRELLQGGGIKRASVSGSGIFKDKSSDAQVRELFFGGTIRNWQLILPDFGTVEGPFQIVALEFAGDHAGEVTFELALESAGEIGFTAL